MSETQDPQELELDRELPSTPLFDDETPFATMMASFDEAAQRLGLGEVEYQILRRSDREIAVSVPVVLDDCSFALFEGYRIQHNQGLGPFMGPLRIAGDLRIDELRALAAWVTWKCAVLGLPFGGAAGGLCMDPEKHTAGELERAVRRYTANILGDIGPERDVISPDATADKQVMAWILDTTSRHARHTVNPAVTGKPVELGGAIGSEKAVAKGLRIITRLATAHFGMPRSPLDFLIQGAGHVGGNLARMLHADGQRIVGMSDVHGGLYNADGLDVPAMLDHRERHGSLAEYEGDFEALTASEFIRRPCDVLVPCAIANAVHSRNAEHVQARLIVEGAHGPVSLRADRILEQRKIPVVPDILANGGGMVMSYFEWVQGRAGLSWGEDVLDRRLSRYMRDAWNAVQGHQAEHSVSLRTAANLLAVERVALADLQRGIYA